MRQSRRGGVAIAVVLLLLLALQVLAHGILLAASQQLHAARAAAHLVEARAWAQGSVRRVLGSPAGLAGDSLPVGGVHVLPERRDGRVVASVTAERISKEVWLIGARATVDGWGGAVGRARLAWVLAPVVRVAAFRAVAHVGEWGPGRPEGSIVPDVLPASPIAIRACAPWYAALDSLLPRRLDPVVVDTAGPLQLGLLDRMALLARASPLETDSVTPAPSVRRGRCDPADNANWGDPGAQRGPCSDRFVFRGRQGNLRVVGGSGQGLLVVTGNLSLEAGADFRGLVLVEGHVSLSEGARLHGLVRAGGAVRMGDTARLLGSACWPARSLHALRDRLGVVLPFPGWGWLKLPQ